MGISCISSKSTGEKENVRPVRKETNKLEISLNPSKLVKSQEAPHRNLPASEAKTSESTHPVSHPSCVLCQERFDSQGHLPVMLCEQ